MSKRTLFHNNHLILKSKKISLIADDSSDVTINGDTIVTTSNIPPSSIILSSVGSSPNPNGATLAGNYLNLEPADSINPGVVSTGAQTFGGVKTFSSPISAPNITGSNTGDVTLAAVGASPNSNGASLVGQTLNLQPADSTNPGVVSTGVQTFAGSKTFSSTISASNFSGTSSGSNSGDVTLAAVGAVPNPNGASLVGQVLNLQPADATNPGVVTTGIQTFAGAKTFLSPITAPSVITSTLPSGPPSANGVEIVGGTAIRVTEASAAFTGVVSTAAQTFSGNKTFNGTISSTNFSGSSSGSNTGDVTLSAIGASPNANGASLVGQALNLQPASASFGGVVTIGAQTFAGSKTFTGELIPCRNNGNSIYIGPGAGASDVGSANANVVCGPYAGYSLTGGVSNCLYGNYAGNFLTNGNHNVLIGDSSGYLISGGSNNICLGNQSGSNVNSGNSNVLLGPLCGNSISSGSNNIVIGPNNTGSATLTNSIILGDNAGSGATSNEIWIGNGQTTCHLQGINGTTLTDEMVCVEPATGKLGKRAIPSGSISLASIGASPNANGATLTGTVLNLEPASASFGGIVTTGAQSFAGDKTFNGTLIPTHGTSFTNTIIGNNTGSVVNAGSAFDNTIIGSSAAAALTFGDQNTCIGSGCGSSITTGLSNTLLGYNAGSGITTSNNNIVIGSVSMAGGGNTINIGSSPANNGANSIYLGILSGPGTHTSCSIAGIRGQSTNPTGIAVFIDAAGKLGTTVSSNRFKKTISDVSVEDLQRFQGIRPKRFKYTSCVCDPPCPPGQDCESCPYHYGVIAEDIDLIYPEYVLHENDDVTQPILSVNYQELFALTMAQVIDLEKRVRLLENPP